MIFYNPKSKYSFFLYLNGQLYADITGLAQNRAFSQTRNGSDLISFSMSEDSLIELGAALHLNLPDLLQPNYTEVRVLRYGVPLVAGEIAPLSENLGGDRVAQITVNGWLELLKARRTSRDFTGSYSALEIVQELLAETFAKPYGTAGNYNGLVLNSYPAIDPTTVYTDQKYDNRTLYDVFTELANETNGFDIEVTWDKKINIYHPHMGSVRKDIVFTYPYGNVKDIQLSIDGSKLCNEITARGNGSGDGQLTKLVFDTPSKQKYGLREDTYDYAAITDEALLINAAQADLNVYKQPLAIQTIIFDGSGAVSAPEVGSFHVGDLIRIYVTNFGLYPNIKQYYIIDKIDVKIGDDDSEEVTLTVGSPTLPGTGV